MIKGKSVIWWAMLIIGSLSMLALLSFRIYSEENDRSAAAAIGYEDLLVLAEKSGESEENWLRGLSDAGVRYLIFSSAPSEDALTAAADAGMIPAAAGELTSGDYAFFLPDPDVYPDTMLDLAMVEDLKRVSVEIHSDFDIDTAENGMIKTFYMFDFYARHFSFSDGGQAMEDLLFRAVTDRGMRLIVLTPFVDKTEGMAADIDYYADVLRDLSLRLEKRGISFGGEVEPMAAKPLNILLCWLCCFLPGAVAVSLACGIPVVKKRFKSIPFFKTAENLLCVFAVIVLGAGWLLLPQLMQKLCMLASAVIFSCAAALSIAKFGTYGSEKLEGKSVFISALTGFLLLFVWALLGGAVVSALMSNRLYLLGGDIFAGVKASLMLPLTLCFVMLGVPIIRDIKKGSLRDWLLFGAAALIVGGVYLMLELRSGDVNTISSAEASARNWLEYNLYARPRTKELIFAVPAVPVFVWACRKKTAPLLLVCGVGACLECVSVINTFCHAVAPLRVSFMRSILAAVIGLAAGFVIVIFLEIISGSRRNKA